MDRAELNERLEILQTAGVITDVAADITIKAFQNLALIINKKEILQSEMLFTHLPSALSRLQKGEKIDGPPEELLAEIKETGFSEYIAKEIDYIESHFGAILPVEEKNYLYLHYATVLQQNVSENNV